MANTDKAVQLLCDALALAEPGGFIRLFVDEGPPMAHLLSAAAAHGMMPDYIGKLLAAFEAEEQRSEDTVPAGPFLSAQPLIEPLSPRESKSSSLIAKDSRIRRSASGCSSPWTRSKDTIGKSLANSRSSGAPKRSRVPASSVCCSPNGSLPAQHGLKSCPHSNPSS